MTIKRVIWLFSIGLFSVCNLWAYKNTYAVIIGVADYKSAAASDLLFASNDAQLFSDFLKSPAGGNVPADHICLLKNEEATKNNIIYQTKILFRQASSEDRVILYFSGHGMSGYVLPYDAMPLGSNWLSYEEIKELFRTSSAKTKLLFADACFAGGFKNSMSGNNSSNSNTHTVKGTADTDIAIMLSCSDNETSIESPYLRQGAFSYFLIKGLKGEADRDGTGKITIQELFYYVYNHTTSYAKARQTSQTPKLFGNFDLRLIVGRVVDKN